MKELESKFMESVLIDDSGKTFTYQILNKKSGFVLGYVKWYGPWRQYCFFPSPTSVFNHWCMNEIVAFIDQLMEDRRPPRTPLEKNSNLRMG